MAFLLPATTGLFQAAADAFKRSAFGRRWALKRIYRREFAIVMRELGSYTDRELAGDLRITRSDIPYLAAAEAERRLGLLVQQHPEYRATWQQLGHAVGAAG